MEGSASAFKRGYLDFGRECFMDANMDNQSKSLLDNKLDCCRSFIFAGKVRNRSFFKKFYKIGTR